MVVVSVSTSASIRVFWPLTVSLHLPIPIILTDYTKVCLSNADLSDANLSDTNLQGTSFQGANLSAAIFTGCHGTPTGTHARIVIDLWSIASTDNSQLPVLRALSSFLFISKWQLH
jgi:hypothetical protein